MNRKYFNNPIDIDWFLARDIDVEYKLVKTKSNMKTEWIETKIDKIKGCCIGYRTLYNGRKQGDYEDGYYFKPQEFIHAALIVYDERKNPIYVAVKDY